jgi:hypothetical protein
MQLLYKRLLMGFIVSAIIMVSGFVATTLVKAQDTGVLVSITGKLDAVNSDGTIIIDGTTYKLGQGVPLPSSAQIGTIVIVTGELKDNSDIVVITISINSPTATPGTTVPVTPTVPAPTPTLDPSIVNPDVIIVVEGPIKKINVNIITIYDIDVLVTPDHPMLKIVKLGDIVRVKGHHNKDGLLVAVVIANVLDPSSTSTVTLDGNVEAINGNIIIINGIPVQLGSNDPLLLKIKIGRHLRIMGNFENNDTTIILIVINVVIVDNSAGLPANCKISKKGHLKCSRKKH